MPNMIEESLLLESQVPKYETIGGEEFLVFTDDNKNQFLERNKSKAKIRRADLKTPNDEMFKRALKQRGYLAHLQNYGFEC